ncbi:PRC-barrel domain-containing protein [Dethiothermospora halolimnae]|uniref:PRC-barrel domain-containing protein n=1 Tax=Dethiothermospora halolimnae TaxID=3114390 RepID=UPI003CCBFFF6
MENDSNKCYAGLFNFDSLEGTEVKNKKNEKLGKIEDLVIDYKEGKVRYVILSVGGFLGIGDKLYAVPFAAFELDEVVGDCTLDIERAKLEEGPNFDRNEWPNFSDQNWANNVHSFYGMQAPIFWGKIGM